MSLRSSPKPAQSTSTRPIFVAAVPRACSTAFERVRDLSQFLHPLASRHTEYPAKQVFMTCPDQVECIHEPFGEPYYYGPERLGFRFNAPDQTDVRSKSGHPETTYRHIFDLLIQKHNFLQKDVATNQAMARRLFIKDIGHYLIPPSGPASSVVPSLKDYSGSFSNISTSTSTSPSPSDLMSDRSNPTVVLVHLLSQFQFAFLIRHPQSSIPSYYRFTVPPLSQNTGFTYFEPTEVGFAELRVLFDLVRSHPAFFATVRTIRSVRDRARCRRSTRQSPRICGRVLLPSLSVLLTRHARMGSVCYPGRRQASYGSGGKVSQVEGLSRRRTLEHRSQGQDPRKPN